MLVLKAILQARPGREKDLEQALVATYLETLKEWGAASPVIHQSEKDSGRYLVYGRYANRDAFEKYITAHYIHDFCMKLNDLAEPPFDAELYEEIAGLNRSAPEKKEG